MAKLYFRYGAVGSAKTLNLLAVAHNYRQQNKKVLLLMPSLDVRFGAGRIRSRAGLETEADILVSKETQLSDYDFLGVDCLLVDEVQFLSANVVDQLRAITLEKDIPVICYGLRTDFRTRLFEGSSRLMELADSIEEIKTTCTYCNRKGTANLKHKDGVPSIDGPSVELGCEEKYFPVCFHCYYSQLAEAKNSAFAESL